MSDTGFAAWARSYLGDLAEPGEDGPSVVDALEKVSGALGKVVDDALVVVGEVARAFDPDDNEEMAALLAELKGGVGRLVDQIEGLFSGGADEEE